MQLLGAVGAAWPLSAHTQQKAMAVIGVLSGEGRGPQFLQGLSDAGYVTGRNVAIEYRIAQGDYDQLPAMAADLVERKVDLIAAFGPAAARAAKAATPTIPIVFLSADPVAEGLVPSLARPGGNLTGISIVAVELMAKRLELLAELVPQARVFGLLVTPKASNVEAMVSHAQVAAKAKGVELHVLNAGSDNYEEIDAAFASLSRLQVGALLVGSDPLLILWRPYLLALTAQRAIPAMYLSSDFTWAGGLISYGPSSSVAFRQLGIYAGRILKGERPASLPVLQPDTFELVINLQTAKALGLAVPQSLLAQADAVIE